MGLYLAIDAGGTKADYALADATRVLARARSGTIKRLRTSAEEAGAHLAGALAELESAAGMSLGGVTRTCIGTAGNTVPLVTEWLRAEMRGRVGGELVLTGDVEIALDAAFPGAAGVLVLAGTGSNVTGRTRAGEIFGAGGYGPVLADQCSGQRIGVEALRALFLAADRGERTLLTEAVLVHWTLASAAELVAYANTCAVAEFSALTPVVLACAQAGDRVARAVLVEQGEELAELALLVDARCAAVDGRAHVPRFAFAGSVMEHVGPARAAVEARLREASVGAELRTGVVAPIEGALWRARRGALRVQ